MARKYLDVFAMIVGVVYRIIPRTVKFSVITGRLLSDRTRKEYTRIRLLRGGDSISLRLYDAVIFPFAPG